MDYTDLRTLHISCASISICLFAARGGMQLAAIRWRQWRWLRIVPHLNDTLLLAAATALAVSSHQYPLAQSWLTAKVVALVVYVFAGGKALRDGISPARQRGWFALALATVAYIVLVAVTRSATWGLW